MVGDDNMILDDNTMGYIRRMLNAKFPAERFPMKRKEEPCFSIQQGRRNFGDQYNLVEAKDIQMKEYERLEQIVNQQSALLNHGFRKEENISADEEKTDTGVETVGGLLNGVPVVGPVLSWLPVPVGYSVEYSEVNKLANDDLSNGYQYHYHLGILPKEEYIQFAKECSEEGKSNYDYLIMFNIHGMRNSKIRTVFNKNLRSDFSISVRVIDIKNGVYIDRNEYLKRGVATSAKLNSPSWRRAMRRAIVDGMIECFDNIPIGKYSVCDNDYCLRREAERKMEAYSGKKVRHCVNHCDANDRSDCEDHIVDYREDADLPVNYIDYKHTHVD